MLESILCLFIRVFSAFIRCLPFSIALFIGRMLGSLAFIFNPKLRRKCYYNLKQAFAETKSPEELRRMVKQFFIQFGQNIIDFMRLPLLTKENRDQLAAVEGIEYACSALAKGKGLIFFAMHFGNWEMASVLGGLLGFPYKIMVNPHPRFPKLDALLNEYRLRSGSVALSTGMGPREFIKVLKNNETMGIVIDQGGKDGVRVPFFGRTASMSIGGLRLALKYDASVCQVSTFRMPNGRNCLKIMPEMKLIKTGDIDNDIRMNLIECIKVMEQEILEYPHTYLWTYKVWKHSDQANIVIVSDGKAGHERQSQAVAKILQGVLKNRKIEAAVEKCLVEYKSVTHAQIASIVLPAVSRFLKEGHLTFLKIFLTKKSYADLMKIKCDYVISCGSSMAGINYVLGEETGSKRIVIQKPGNFSYKRFSALILPQHDKKNDKEYQNVIFTKGSPNLITPEYLKDMGHKLVQRYPMVKKDSHLKIGVLIGGDAKNMFIAKEQIRVLMHQLKAFAAEFSMRLLVTTSRRTSVEVEHILTKELSNDPLCAMLVIANRNNFAEAVGGILGESDFLVVSGDSISMVSEALSSGKPTVVFKPEFRRTILKQKFKHEIFVDQLNDQGFVFVTEEKNIGEVLGQMAKKKIQARVMDDEVNIIKALERIL
ncbi:MAG: mitochondrial fission ELM1 family protein [Candidatus Omnitrophica bacterium]|nr:mitochondrial fission ELM1 family protein [Candidatus Omnitrophota bacterium]